MKLTFFSRYLPIVRNRAFRSSNLPCRLLSSTSNAKSELARPLSQPTYYTHSDLMSSSDVTPGISRSEYKNRRQQLAQFLPQKSLSIYPSNTLKYMSEDVPYLYHHNTDLMYLCGIKESGSCLAVERHFDSVRYTLFVQQRNSFRELWDGPLCGTGDEIKHYFSIDDIRETSELPNYISENLSRVDSFHFDSKVSPSTTNLLAGLRQQDQAKLLSVWDQDTNPKSFLRTLRLMKSDSEIELLRQAGSTISKALNQTMATSWNGQSVDEKQIEAMIEFECKTRGADRMAFPCVVAGGSNGTILHYMNNDTTLFNGDFVMVDAGCEVHGYCSDLSRSWPVSGKFTGPQLDLYNLTLDVQKKCISLSHSQALIEGQQANLDALHAHSVRLLTDGLLQLGFMKGHSVDSAISTNIYMNYFPHAVGHYLGMDVHDTHELSKSIPFKKNMVITVEPGIYCPLNDTSAPAAFRGIGMRIEDDVVIGQSEEEIEVLTSAAVKETNDIESIVGSAQRISSDQLSDVFSK